MVYFGGRLCEIQDTHTRGQERLLEKMCISATVLYGGLTTIHLSSMGKGGLVWLVLRDVVGG